MRQVVSPGLKDVLAQAERAIQSLPAQEQAELLNRIMAELLDMQAEVLRKGS